LKKSSHLSGLSGKKPSTIHNLSQFKVYNFQENMYSSIANNSFSYLLTLNEFRDNISDEFKPSLIKITTITMVSKFMQDINIKRLRTIFEKIGSLKLKREGVETDNSFEWTLKPTTFYNQITLTYHDQYSTKSVKLFPNGSVQVAGCCDLFDCKRIIVQLSYILKKFLDMDDIPIDSYRIVMINSNFSLNYNLNLIKVAEHFEKYSDIFKVSFEPDRYSAVKVKFKPAQDMKEITTSINQHINEEPQVRVSRTVETDVFDVYLGYKNDSMLKYIRERGFKSWMYTIENRKINF
jgi:hypothetical protein